jgi:hypothetical protein
MAHNDIAGFEERDGMLCPTLNGKPLLDGAGNAIWLAPEQLQQFQRVIVEVLAERAAKAGQ